MPSSLTDVNISDTYIGVLHAYGQQLPANDRAVVYDGYGNASALSVGVSGNGVAVLGPSTFTTLSATTVNCNIINTDAYVSAPNTVKAWALIQGNGTITSQYNVGSVVRNSTGDFTVYFTSQMPTADYGVNITIAHDNTSNKMVCAYVKAVPAPNVANFSFRTDYLNTGTVATPFNPTSICITVNHL